MRAIELGGDPPRALLEGTQEEVRALAPLLSQDLPITVGGGWVATFGRLDDGGWWWSVDDCSGLTISDGEADTEDEAREAAEAVMERDNG